MINKKTAKKFIHQLNKKYKNHPQLLKNIKEDRKALNSEFAEYAKGKNYA